MNETNVLTDDSPMPIGRHKDKRMEEVPAKYLMFLYSEWAKSDFRVARAAVPVLAYIRENLDVLNKELSEQKFS